MNNERERLCGVPGCTIRHGLYPENEHQLMEMSEEKFQALHSLMSKQFGMELTREADGLYVTYRMILLRLGRWSEDQ